MDISLDRDHFEFLIETIVEGEALKPPKQEKAMMEAIYKAGTEGASVEQIKNYFKKTGTESAVFSSSDIDTGYTVIKRALDKLKLNINRKLSDYYFKMSYSLPFDMVVIGTSSKKRKVKYILEAPFRTFSLTYPFKVASSKSDPKSIHSEWPSIIGSKPSKLDYMGTVFDKGFGSTDFRMNALANIKEKDDSSYRIIMLHPESELLAEKTRIYAKTKPVKTDLAMRIDTCLKYYRKLKRILPRNKKDRIQLRLCRVTPFIWSRFLILPGKEVHIRMTNPETGEKTKLYYTDKSVMYKFAVDAFEIMWSDSFSEPAPEE